MSLYRTARAGGLGDITDIGHRGVTIEALSTLAHNATWAAQANRLSTILKQMDSHTQDHPAPVNDMQAVSTVAYEFLAQVTPFKTVNGLGGATNVEIAANEAKRTEAVKWLTKVAHWWSSALRTIAAIGNHKLDAILRIDTSTGPTIEWLADREYTRVTSTKTWLNEFKAILGSTPLLAALGNRRDINDKPAAFNFFDHAEILIVKRLNYLANLPTNERQIVMPYIGVSKTCCVICEHSLRDSGYGYRGGSGHLYKAALLQSTPGTVVIALKQTLIQKLQAMVVGNAGDNIVSSDDE
jgi:hypothetical protein